MWETINRAGFARIEYRAVQALVERKLAEGFTVKLIHENLTADGSLTMGYKTFCDYVRGGGKRLHGRKKDAQKKTPNQTKASSASSSSDKFAKAGKDEPFRIERMTLEELI